jgi:lipopolysaccharide export system protein LptA
MNSLPASRREVILLLVLCHALLWMLVPGSVAAQTGGPVILEHADSLWNRMIDGEAARELIGNVALLQGNVHITCDRALQFTGSGKVNLTGHVVVWDDSVTLTAPRGSYYRDERRAEGFEDVRLDDGKSHLTAEYGEYRIEPRIAFFRTHVIVRDTASTITADSLTYYRNTRKAVATGRVALYNHPDNVTITGGRLENDSPLQYSRVTVDPLLMQVDTSTSGGRDTLLVKGRVLESFRDSVRRLVATDSVEILRADLAARGRMVQFFTQGDSIMLRESPVMWYQRTQVTGDSINVYLRARRLHLVSVMGSAVAVSQGDSLRPKRFDQLTGELMKLSFKDQQLSSIDVETRAISVYHLYEDSLANGLNRTSGDRIIMRFGEGKLKAIMIVGGVEGQYYPENMVEKRENEYRVPGFSWRGDRPVEEHFIGGRSVRGGRMTDRSASAPPAK